MILEVRNLKTYFNSPDGLVKAVDGICFELERGETLALVGESGCGKSVTALTIMGLIKSPPARIEGSIKLDGIELIGLSNEEYRKIRGKRISMIFQEPMASFDPLYTIGKQMKEVAMTHFDLSEDQAKEKCIEMMKKVHIPLAEKRFDEYPHEMSGGMLQRIMIAMSLLTNPDILIADEPTTALDVTIQAQILNLMKELQQMFNMSMIFITHDFGVVAEMADRVHVMYAGKIVEKATVKKLFSDPKHPYTQGLLQSRVKKDYKGKLLPFIPGNVPLATNFPDGCRFHPRCPYAMEICKKQSPIEINLGDSSVMCWLYAGRDVQ